MRVSLQVATPITLVLKPWGTPRLLLPLFGLSLPAQPLTPRSVDRVLCSRNRRLHRSTRHAFGLPYAFSLAALGATDCLSTCLPHARSARRDRYSRSCLASSRLRRATDGSCLVGSALVRLDQRIDRPTSGNRWSPRRMRHALCCTDKRAERNGLRSVGSHARTHHRHAVDVTAAENLYRARPICRADYSVAHRCVTLTEFRSASR